MFEVKVSSFFSAARRLPGLGPSEELHGQTFRVDVVFARETLDNRGVVADYWVLKRQLDETLQAFDHSYLNDLSFFSETPPTTERLCQVIAQALQQRVPECQVARVAIEDTPHTQAAYSP